MPFPASLETSILNQIWGGGSAGQIGAAGITAGSISSISTTALTAAIPINTLILVSPGSPNQECFNVSASASIGATTLTVTTQTALNAHASGDHIQIVASRTIGAVGPVLPPILYCALSTTAAPTVTEPVGNAYTRVAVPNNPTNFPAATGSLPATKNNGTAVTFPQATGAWGTIISYAWYDAPTGGNLIGQFACTSQVIGNLDTPSFAVSTTPVTLN